MEDGPAEENKGRPWLVVTFKGQRNRHSEGSKKAGGRESEGSQRTLQQPPGCNMQGSGEPKSGPLGWRSQGGPGEKLAWCLASLVLDLTEGRRRYSLGGDFFQPVI